MGIKDEKLYETEVRGNMRIIKKYQDSTQSLIFGNVYL